MLHTLEATARPGTHPLLRRRPMMPSLDRLIHERLRLGLLAALAVNERLTFTELRDILEVTDGNLSEHARKLENAGYVRVEKSFQGRKPRTAYSLTAHGRQALRTYIETMQTFLEAMEPAEEPGPIAEAEAKS